MSAQIILPGTSYRESTYGMGWIRTQLPNQMCKISPNMGMLGKAPIVGKGAAPKLVIAHYGSMPGSYSGVNLFPESESVIVVLINSTPRCDLADWMTQLLMQTLFDFPQKHEYVQWVRETVDAELRWYAQTLEQMSIDRQIGTSPGDLNEYVGEYHNSANTFSISIRRKGDVLYLAFESRANETFAMQHYHNHTFSWLQPRDDLVSRA